MDICIRILYENADIFSGYFFKFLNYCTNEDNFANVLNTGFTLENVMKLIVLWYFQFQNQSKDPTFMNPTDSRKKLSLLYLKFQSLSLLFSTQLWPFDHYLVGKDIKKAGYAHNNAFYKSCENSDEEITFLELPADYPFK